MKWINRLLLPFSLVFVVCYAVMALRVSAVRTNAQQSSAVELPILMYHHLLKDTSRLNAYTITPDAFRADLEWLRNQGYTPIVVQDLIDFTQNGKPLPPHPVMITFDDGYESFHEYAFPILQELEFKAVYAVIGRYVDQYSATEDHHIAYSHSTWNQLRQMRDSGLVEIQNHSYNMHSSKGDRKGSKKMPGETIPAYHEALASDLERVQQECEENIGWTPTAFAFPFGYISSEAFDPLRALGLQAAFTCEEKLNQLTGNPDELFRLRRFNRPNGISAEQLFRRAGATLPSA